VHTHAHTENNVVLNLHNNKRSGHAADDDDCVTYSGGCACRSGLIRIIHDELPLLRDVGGSGDWEENGLGWLFSMVRAEIDVV
jgi:hypothetical protein